MQKNKSDVLPAGSLFPSYGTELIPLLPYLRAGLLKGRGGNVGIAPGNRPLLSDYGLIRVSSRPGEVFVSLFMSSL